MPDVASILASLSPLLQRTDHRPVAVLMCGMAGSGKSTLSHAITTTHPHFTRLSNDAIIHEQHGLYGIDYDRALYDQYQDEADGIFDARLASLLEQGMDVVVDRSLYAREDREAMKRIVQEKGGMWVLVCFRVGDKEMLWRRIEARRAAREGMEEGKKGDAAYEITREVFESYWAGFEWPEGEGEVVVAVE